MKPPDAGQVVVRVKWAGINGGCETFRARGEAAFVRNKYAFPLVWRVACGV